LFLILARVTGRVCYCYRNSVCPSVRLSRFDTSQ